MISDILLSKFYEEYSQDKDSLQNIDIFDINSKKYRDYFYTNEMCDFFKLRDIICKIIFKIFQLILFLLIVWKMLRNYIGIIRIKN